MNKIKTKAAICSLALLVFLPGCERKPDGLELIGEIQPETVDVTEQSAEEPIPEPVAEIFVHVCGAVKEPGVVRLPEDSRAADALTVAGGFREDAAQDAVNLAARLTDGEKLYFPTVEEAAMPASENDTIGLVNINTADKDALCSLPGIGEAKAEDILRYREENGFFGSCEDIMLVPGIKTSVYNKIKEKITVK